MIARLQRSIHYQFVTYYNITMLTPKRLETLIDTTKMVGEFYLTAAIHPCNFPELNEIESLNGTNGFVVACNLYTKQQFLFHESQMHRIV
jgi:hypothetical protein